MLLSGYFTVGFYLPWCFFRVTSGLLSWDFGVTPGITFWLLLPHFGVNQRVKFCFFGVTLELLPDFWSLWFSLESISDCLRDNFLLLWCYLEL